MNDVPSAIQQWIDLVDLAERIMHPRGIWGAEQHRRMRVVLEALGIQDHAMTEAERETARRMLWQRDHPGEPLPPDPSRWRRCQCRRCFITRRLGRPSQIQ